MQILGLFGMYYFDAVVVEVKTFLLLFRFTLAILWLDFKHTYKAMNFYPAEIVDMYYVNTSQKKPRGARNRIMV